MARFGERFKRLAIVASGIATVMAPAMARAEAWSPTVTIDSTPVLTVAGTVLTALGAIWAVRKVIKTVNRS